MTIPFWKSDNLTEEYTVDPAGDATRRGTAQEARKRVWSAIRLIDEKRRMEEI